MSEAIQSSIGTNAVSPAAVTVDGNSVTAQRIADQIAADRYLSGGDAAAKNHLGLQFVKLVPPGAG